MANISALLPPSLVEAWNSLSKAEAVAVCGVLGTAGLVTAWAVLDARLRARRPSIHLPLVSAGGAAGLATRHLLTQCPSLHQTYRPVPLLTNRHVETICASLFRRAPRGVRYVRELMLTGDGGAVALDWESTTAEKLPPSAPVVILLPGLTGGSHNSYVVHAVRRAASHGLRAVVFNSRGTSDSPVKTPQYYSASFTGDLRQVVRHVQGRFPAAEGLVAAGWSLGANILVRYLGEEGERCPLRGAVSLCNPFDLTLSHAHIRRGLSRLYDARLASNLVALHRKHLHVWQGVKGPFKLDQALRARTIRDFDDALTIHSFGWPSVEAYYQGSSSARSVPLLRVPLLCIQARDDPIAPEQAIPYQALAENPHALLVVTPHGGHLGWTAGDAGPFAHPWTDPGTFEFLTAALKAPPPPPPGPATSPTAALPPEQAPAAAEPAHPPRVAVRAPPPPGSDAALHQELQLQAEAGTTTAPQWSGSASPPGSGTPLSRSSPAATPSSSPAWSAAPHHQTARSSADSVPHRQDGLLLLLRAPPPEHDPPDLTAHVTPPPPQQQQHPWRAAKPPASPPPPRQRDRGDRSSSPSSSSSPPPAGASAPQHHHHEQRQQQQRVVENCRAAAAAALAAAATRGGAVHPPGGGNMASGSGGGGSPSGPGSGCSSPSCGPQTEQPEPPSSPRHAVITVHAAAASSLGSGAVIVGSGSSGGGILPVENDAASADRSVGEAAAAEVGAAGSSVADRASPVEAPDVQEEEGREEERFAPSFGNFWSNVVFALRGPGPAAPRSGPAV